VPVDATRVVFESPIRRYALVDGARHVDQLVHVLTTALDAAILVVSAADGPMPQTREHVLIAGALGIPLVVFLSRGGDEQYDDLIEQEVRVLLLAHGYSAATRVVRGSGGAGLRDLVTALDLEISAPTDDPVPRASRFEAEVYLLETDDGGRDAPLRANDPVELRFGTTDTCGAIARVVASSGIVQPGENATCEIALTAPMAVARKHRFTIREGGRVVAVGGVAKVTA
jgi:elongation factor Tu